MSESPFRIAVTGDTGFDIFTEYVQGHRSADLRVRKPEAAIDIEVPSGAELTSIALRQMLANNSGSPSEQIHVDSFLPEPFFEREAHTKRSFTTLWKFLVDLKRIPEENKSRHRVNAIRPLVDSDELEFKDGKPEKADCFDNIRLTNQEQDFQLLVVHDGPGLWRQYDPQKKVQDGLKRAIDLFDMSHPRRGDGAPSIIVNLNYDLPSVVRQSGELRFEDMPVWQELEKRADRVCVICSANTLRREGAAISRRLSWEQTVEDLASELHLFDKLAMLARFRHLIFRFGIVGAVYLRTEGRKRTGDLIFSPTSEGGGFYRDTLVDGTLLNQNDYIIAALAQMVGKFDPENERELFVNALKKGLYTCQAAFDQGYQLPWNPDDESSRQTSAKDKVRYTPEDGIDFITRHYKELRKRFDGWKIDGVDHVQGHARIPASILTYPPGLQTNPRFQWEILHHAIDPQANLGQDVEGNLQNNESVQISRINVGMAIVMHGSGRVLNRHFAHSKSEQDLKEILERPSCAMSQEETPDFRTLAEGQLPQFPGATGADNMAASSIRHIFVPSLNIKKAIVLERREIESLRSIRNLFRLYVERCKESDMVPPISIAVFGPPGSGKSFIVKQIARDVCAELAEVEYNVSQFRSVDDIGDAIIRASSLNNEGKIPLIFFDEFDCSLDGKELGWLKYFLAPMQDGTFCGARQTIKIARAIFVFAGGVFESFSKFDPSSSFSPSLEGETESEKIDFDRFKACKGPDFISRLRGHIDILPINASAGKVKPILRRALVLRSLLEHYHFVTRQESGLVSNIDEDVVYALLTMDRYRHGTRSMEAILQMCTPMEGRIEKASLPSKKQMDMHINAEEFAIRMARSRCRRDRPDDPKAKKDQKKSTSRRSANGDNTSSPLEGLGGGLKVDSPKKRRRPRQNRKRPSSEK